jgi:hypothetical protein
MHPDRTTAHLYGSPRDPVVQGTSVRGFLQIEIAEVHDARWQRISFHWSLKVGRAAARGGKSCKQYHAFHGVSSHA